MKNKNGKKNINIWVILLLVGAVIAAYFLISSQNVGTITQHAQTPADMSKSSTGTGLKLNLYNCPDNLLNQPVITNEQLKSCTQQVIPSSFSTASIISPFAIVKTPNPATCTTVSNCAGYTPGSSVMCWNGQCVMGNINTLSLDFGVQNPSSSQVTFNNVQVSTALPSAFYTVRNTSVVSSMVPGTSYTFAAGGAMSISGNNWMNTNQTFSVTVQGTNSYTGAITTSSDSYTLGFYPDPSGALNVSIVKAV